MLLITKGQQELVVRPEPLALCAVASWQSGLMHLTYDQVNGVMGTSSVRPNRTLAASFNNAPSVVRATSGAIQGPKPKNGVATPTVILALSVPESKGQNDVPQLRDSVQEVRERSQRKSAVPLREML